MNGKNVIDTLQKSIDNLRDQNINTITIDQFELYIRNADRSLKACHETHLEIFKAVISTGTNAIKSAMLINGGGAIALLTFYPHAKQVIDPSLVKDLSLALLYFGIGVFIAAFGSGFAYFTNRAYLESNDSYGNLLNILSAILIFIAYVMFIFGIYSASKSLGLTFC